LSDTLVRVEGLKKYFPISGGVFKKTVGYVYAVDGVSFDIPQGETVGLVGESGCGKTTVGRCILRLINQLMGEYSSGRRTYPSGKVNSFVSFEEKCR
jgi:peptide/nickel transport system ATP-binding protein